ncbi:MAG TPA: molybdopterin-binding protein [Pseudolabrys sp.]|nr:molybdopterin-binding protein [Pseudolabrys sp.]
MLTTDESAQIISRLTPLADVLAAIDAVAPVAPRELAPALAVGRVLASDVTLSADAPAAPLALRDGFALSADATLDASAYAPVVLPALPPRVDVGDALPSGTDAVAGVDEISVRHGRAEVLTPLAHGQGVLPRGGDAAAGCVLRRAGSRLRGIDAAACAALGVERVAIHKPRLRLICTREDRVLAAALAMIESDIERIGNALAGDPGRLDRELNDGDPDALIVIGGTGAGRDDRSVQALSRAGTVIAHGIGLAPGETAAFGRVGMRPVLLVPGRIDAAFAVWHTLGRRLLAGLSGWREPEPSTSATLSRKVTSTVGLVDVVPVALVGGKAEPLATKVLPMAALTRADGHVLVPANSEGYPAGAQVTVRPWS